MSLIDEIKERLDIIDLVGGKIELRQVGKSWKGRCPFHEDNSPSLVVRQDTQRFRCYGCGARGDVIEFWEKFNRVDKKDAIRELAQKAGIQVGERKEDELHTEQREADRNTVFTAAAAYFQEVIISSKAGKRYATEERCWPENWLKEQSIGWFGKDWNGLREYLRKAQIDLKSPAAVALVGFRGDVAGWAKTHGIEANPVWISNKKIPAMPPHMLIYSHFWRGQVCYLTGRRVSQDGSTQGYSGPKAWNPPEELVGPKQGYFNLEWLPAARQAKGKSFVIVEGQGCGVTLAGMGLPAVALAGSNIGGAGQQSMLVSELRRAVSSGGRIVLALDNDNPGIKAEKEAVKLLMEDVGLNAAQLARLRWPESGKDANGWLKDGATRDDFHQAVTNAESWLEVLIEDAQPGPGQKAEDEAVQAVFDALASLNSYETEKWRDEIIKNLGIRPRLFNAMLKDARLKCRSDEEQQPFFVRDGRTYMRTYDAGGNENSVLLCNFEGHIVRDVKRDNGQDVAREFHIAGRIGDRWLPVARVPAKEFSGMTWALSEWGVGAVIEPGGQFRDLARAAIQKLSPQVEEKTIYTHTGWREIESTGSGIQRVFLSMEGAIGAPGLEVDLPDDLKNYRVPTRADDPSGAMSESLKFLGIAPMRVTAPLWASVWLAPLCELVSVAFALWVYGGTGAMKSTLVAATLNHYGADWNDKALPGNFIDTPNTMEYKAFAAKDVPLVVDDFTPQADARSAQEYTQKAHRIVRGVGNKAGRGRLDANARMKATYTPRGLVLITGEDLPESEALVARLFVVEMKRGDVDISKLSAFQAQRARLPHALSGYIAWMIDDWHNLQTTVPARWQDYRLNAFSGGMHLRLPEAVAGLALGWEMGLRYAASLKVISSCQFGKLLEDGWQVILQNAQEMAARVKEEKPERLFCRTISTLLTQGKIFLRGRDLDGKPLGGPSDRSDMVGWYDADWFYLLPEASYNLVSKYFRDQGNVFPVREHTLRKALDESGILGSRDGRLTPVVYLDGKSRRVLVLKRLVFDDVEERPSS